MKSLIRECRHYSGDFLEVDWFPVRKPNSKRKAKAKPSTEAQKALNARNAKRRLTWLIQENFGTNDFMAHLTYPAELDNDYLLKAKMFERWLRRVKAKYKKADIEFKYVSCSEIGKQNHRLHHHIICSGDLGAQILRDEWIKQFGKNYGVCCKIDNLKFTRSGLAKAAWYTAKDPMLSYRSYNCSKNLKRPEPKNRDGRISGKKLLEMRQDLLNKKEFERLYPGYTFVDADRHLEMYDVNEYGEVNEREFPYLTIRLYRSDTKYIIADEE